MGTKRYLKRNLLGDNETSLGLRGDRPYTNDGGSEESWLGSVTAFLSSVWDDLTGDDKKKVIQKILDKQNAEGAEKNKGILSEWEREGEWQDNDYYSGLLASDELELYDDSPDKQDKLDISDSINESMYGFDSDNQDPIRQNERELSALSAPDAPPPASKMSPAGKKALVGLLKDFLTPAPDAPPTQVRGAGIIRGGGTPFPSLLQKRPERKYYQNKGLG